MKNISSMVDKALKKHTGEGMPELNYNLSTNLELRLLFPVIREDSYKEARKKFLRNYLNEILTLSLGNISEAAKKAHLHRRHLHRIINELEIDAQTHRKEMIKPSEYIKESVHMILEETLSGLGKESQKIREVYSNISDISEALADSIEETPSYEEAISLFEKEFLGKALRENNYDIQKTAETLDMSQRTLYRKISRFNLAIA